MPIVKGFMSIRLPPISLLSYDKERIGVLKVEKNAERSWKSATLDQKKAPAFGISRNGDAFWQ